MEKYVTQKSRKPEFMSASGTSGLKDQLMIGAPDDREHEKEPNGSKPV